jgi:hypothetical protein
MTSQIRARTPAKTGARLCLLASCSADEASKRQAAQEKSDVETAAFAS